ncbi:MAG: hypothetical protein AAF639_14915 [Chloroflexota bacterium]
MQLPQWIEVSSLPPMPDWVERAQLQVIMIGDRLHQIYTSRDPAAPYAQFGIDMGNGRHLGAEDVLDGHFKRLSELNPAINALAPGLTPLTNLAEDLADSVPNVQPTDQFRANLQQALQESHRQQSAQRVLGTCRVTQMEIEQKRASRQRTIAQGILAVVTLFVVYVVFKRRRRAG